MLQWEWPLEWDEEFLRQLRQRVEQALVRAMSSNSQIGGRVEVSDVHLGRTPPEIRVNSIQDISCARTSITLGVKYQGEASIALRGLRINVGEMCSFKMPGSLGEDDANHALPLHLPFGVKIHHIHIEGEVALEFDQVIVEKEHYVDSTPRLPNYAMNITSGGTASTFAAQQPCRNESFAQRQLGQKQSTSSSPAGAAVGSNASTGEGSVSSPPSRSRSSAGCGIVFPSGGVKNMRQPEGETSSNSVTANGRLSGQMKGPSALGNNGASGSAPASSNKFCFSDVASGRAQVQSRTLRLQFFGDPLKNFSVESNLDTMKGTREKVEGTLKKLVRPAIEALMMNGVEFKL